jgi:hypothetical protein
VADTKEDETVQLLELLVSSLAQIDTLSKLLIDKGVIEEEEYLGHRQGFGRCTTRRHWEPLI